jgi:hypothetical protein
MSTSTGPSSPTGAEPITSPIAIPIATISASEQQLARRLLAAYEREFWAGHHDRSRLLAAPLRVLHQALPPGAEATALLSGVLQALTASTATDPAPADPAPVD